MKICEIRELLNLRFPSSLSEEWDNDGDMLCIDPQREVTGIVTALDVTDMAVDEAVRVGANLIVSHHPMIFKPLKRLDSSALAKRIERLIKADISVLSYHTRFDSAKGGMNDILAEKVGLINPAPFGFEGEIPMGRIGGFPECSPGEFATQISIALNTHVTYFEGTRQIKRVAVLGGGGKDFIHLAHTLGADAMVTGDITYSVANDELPYGITMVDAGHYPTEVIAVDAFAELLEDNFDIAVHRFYGENPAKIVTLI